jgi:hypothetical protein
LIGSGTTVIIVTLLSAIAGTWVYGFLESDFRTKTTFTHEGNKIIMVSAFVRIGYSYSDLKPAFVFNNHGKDEVSIRLLLRPAEEWQAPDINNLPDDEQGKMIRYGHAVISNTSLFLVQKET